MYTRLGVTYLKIKVNEAKYNGATNFKYNDTLQDIARSFK